jgi:hypothetical protein
LFVFVEAVEPGYWQCTAFDQYENPFSAAGPDRDSAAYNALYDCGGDDYQDTCFIPAGYCNIR